MTALVLTTAMVFSVGHQSVSSAHYMASYGLLHVWSCCFYAQAVWLIGSTASCIGWTFYRESLSSYIPVSPWICSILSNPLLVPRTQTLTIGPQAFALIPVCMEQPHSLNYDSVFRWKLKTFLFNPSAYWSVSYIFHVCELLAAFEANFYKPNQ